jgi:hypothetical protein
MAKSERSRGRGRYYTPAATILDVPGVKVIRNTFVDVYQGAMEDLISAGVATKEMFPGQAGVGAYSAFYRPVGVARHAEGWHWTPGYLRITRCGADLFCVALTVSRETSKRRKTEAVTRRSEAEREEESKHIDLAGKFRDVLLGSEFAEAAKVSPACFNEGDIVLYVFSDGDTEPVTIVGGFDRYKVRESGWRLGYVVRDDDGRKCFAPPHMLVTADNRIRHIRLVSREQGLSSRDCCQ